MERAEAGLLCRLLEVELGMRIVVDPQRGVAGLRALPETTSMKRPARIWPISSSPKSLLPSAAVWASSPSTISSGSGGVAPTCQISRRPPRASTRSSLKKKPRQTSPETCSCVQVYSSPGAPTSIEPATSSKKPARQWQPKLPERT
ncbi:hypothetical protein GGD63_008025 [Bradyrhizobium sp. cir1]|nr:hypothetical protein [Bradyrhizobium sp. cir1]